MVLNSQHSTDGHEVEFFYELNGVYGFWCSCGLRRVYKWIRVQNVNLHEILSWMAYKHTGKAPQWSSTPSS